MLPPLLPQEACCITTLLTVHTGGKGCSPYGLHVDVTKEPLAGMTPRAVAEASPGASGQRGTSPTLQIVLRGPVLGDGAHKGFLSAVRVLPSQAVRLDSLCGHPPQPCALPPFLAGTPCRGKRWGRRARPEWT